MIHVTKYEGEPTDCDICGQVEGKKFCVTNDKEEEGYILCHQCKNLMFPKER